MQLVDLHSPALQRKITGALSTSLAEAMVEARLPDGAYEDRAFIAGMSMRYHDAIVDTFVAQLGPTEQEELRRAGEEGPEALGRWLERTVYSETNPGALGLLSEIAADVRRALPRVLPDAYRQYRASLQEGLLPSEQPRLPFDDARRQLLSPN